MIVSISPLSLHDCNFAMQLSSSRAASPNNSHLGCANESLRIINIPKHPFRPFIPSKSFGSRTPPTRAKNDCISLRRSACVASAAGGRNGPSNANP